MRQTLLQKVWDKHAVRTLPTGQTQLFIGLHLIHEVTSPQAFDMLRMRGGKVAFPNRTFATVDHIVPTLDQRRPFLDVLAEEMMSALEKNCREFGIPLYDITSANQGIVHVIGLEIIRRLGVKGGSGYAYEYGGETFDRMTMEERMTVCNMSIEGAARVGYVNPDETTFSYLEGRPFAPRGGGFTKARQ